MLNTRGRISVGMSTITLFFMVVYISPLILNEIFYGKIVSIYKIEPPSFLSILFILEVYVLYFLIAYLTQIKPAGEYAYYFETKWQAWFKFYRNNRFYIGLLLVCFSMVSMYMGLNDHRYSYTGISERSSILFVLLAVKSLLLVDFFFTAFLDWPKSSKKFSKTTIANILYAISFALMVSGTGDALIAIIILGYAVFPRLFTLVVFNEKHKKVNLSKLFIRYFLLPILAVVILLSSILIGQAIKSLDPLSSEFTISSIFSGHGGVGGFIYYLVESISSHLRSFIYVVAQGENITGSYIDRILIPVESLFYRLNVVLGSVIDMPRPDISSFSQFNYKELAIDPFDQRQGTSPGLLASFVYALPLPLSILFSAIYLAVISRFLDKLFLYGPVTLSFLGYLVLLLLMFPFFQSPFDLLLIFDNISIYIILMAILYFAKDNKSIKCTLLGKVKLG